MSLCDKSLTVVERSETTTRYRLLETVRQYAHDRLPESGDADVWRINHVQYFLALAEEAESKLTGAEQIPWLGRLEAEADNLRAAMEVCAAPLTGGGEEALSGSETGLRLTGALWLFWNARSYLTEGRERLARALEREPGPEPSKAVRAKALRGLGNLMERQGSVEESVPYFEESLALSREIGNKGGISAALHRLGWVAMMRDDVASGWALNQESLALSRSSSRSTCLTICALNAAV